MVYIIVPVQKVCRLILMLYQLTRIPLLITLFILCGFGSAFTEALNEKEYWMEIFSDNRKIGFSHTLIDNKDGKIIISENSTINISLMGNTNEIKVSSEYEITGNDLHRFRYKMSAESVELDLNGKVADGQLIISNNRDDGKTVKTQFDKDYVVPSLLPLRLSSQGLDEGDQITVYIFDPLTFYTGGKIENMKADVKVGKGDTVSTPAGKFRANRVVIDHLGTRSTMWITNDGTLVKESTPPGFISYLSTESSAGRVPSGSVDLGSKIAIPVTTAINSPREVKKLKVKISGVENLNGLDLNDGYRQELKGNTLTVRSGSLTEKSHDKQNKPEKLNRYLGSSNLINPGDPEIAKQSSIILKEEKDPLKKVKLLNKWVNRNLEKVPLMSIPDAGEVLASKKGDCNEHAVLFTALARAADIPAKVIMGLIYLDGKFHYHAWNEVYIDGWVAVDSTFGQLPADATHIKILEGDISRSPEIIKVVGKMKLDVLYYE